MAKEPLKKVKRRMETEVMFWCYVNDIHKGLSSYVIADT